MNESVLYFALVAIGIAACRWSANPLKELKLGIFRPFRLLATFWLVYLSVSYLGTFWLVNVGVFDPIDFRLAFRVQIVALAAVTLGYNLVFLVIPAKAPAKQDGELRFDLAFLHILSSLAVALGLFATLLWFAKTGVIPMLYDGDRDAIRFELAQAPGLGMLSRIIYLSPVFIMLKLTCMMLPKRRDSVALWWLDIALLGGLFVALLLFGSKMLVVGGLAMALLNFNYFRRRIDVFKVRWIVTGLILLILLTLVTNLRGTNESVVIDPISDLMVVFPEFRDMAQTLNISSEQNLYVSTLWTGISSAVPRELYTILGVVKPTEKMDELAYFQKQLLGYEFSGGSARTGFVAELFLEGRWAAVTFGALIYGALFGWMELLLCNPHLYDFRAILANVFTFQFIWFLLAELPTYGPILFLFVYFMLLVYWLVRRPANAPLRVLAVPELVSR